MSNVRNFDSFINEQSYLLEMLDASSQIALNNVSIFIIIYNSI